MRGNHISIVDLSKYHTDGKEAHYIQIVHIVGQLTENKANWRQHKESWIPFYFGPENSYIKNPDRPGDDKNPSKYAERRKRYGAGKILTGFRQIINMVRSNLRGRPNCRTYRLEKKTYRHTTFRSLRHNWDVIGCKKILVAGNAEVYRRES